MQQAVYCESEFYLSGHDHDLELIAPGADANCPGVAFVVSGAGSKVSDSAEIPVPQQLFYDKTVEGFVDVLFAPCRCQ